MADLTTTVLLILDGWGYCPQSKYNAIAAAHTPQWDKWWQQEATHTLLEASGPAVGLPDNQMGNSEVGHMHIGAGRIIFQDYTRINEAIKRGDYFNNAIFINAINDLKKRHRSLHLLGLLSPGGVHSHEEHLFAFLKLCAKHQFNRVYLHLFLDGRDTAPQQAKESLQRLQRELTKYPVANISSLSGRYYAMDRDKRWSRIKPVYELLTQHKSTPHYDNAMQALTDFYHQGIYDEFIPPTRISNGQPIQDEDGVFFFNFRADRARQLTQALLSPVFDGFKREKTPTIKPFISMTRYADNLPTEVAFPTESLPNTLGDILSKHGLRQLRIAETEKYAHVTFFLNGGSEAVYPQEERLLIPSPTIATYDLQPEMSAFKLTEHLISSIKTHQHDVIIANFANADMVGHTGNFAATVKAIECLDHCMKRIGDALAEKKGQLFITADHGNAEIMFNEQNQQIQTAHTNQPVPFLYLGSKGKLKPIRGSLIDIAPTILDSLNIAPPPEMTGQSLLEKNHDA